MGEGFQNNHHKFPHSANFSYRWYELDLGYLLCRGSSLLGLIKINESMLLKKEFKE